jgi:predicted transcriptional regulator
MLANQLITTHYPKLHLKDQVSVALQLMDDFDIQHLPIIAEEKFLGLVSKDDLLDHDETTALLDLEADLLKKAVRGGEHFLSALKLASSESLSLVPVVNESLDWLGAITSRELLKSASDFTGAEEPGAIVVLEVERKDYSFGEISRLVETNNAYITQFNTSTETETGLLIVTIKLNKIEVSDIIATFQRYEYIVRYYIGEEHYENELRYNYDHLMTYLKI